MVHQFVSRHISTVIAMKLCADIYGPSRMNTTDFGVPLILHLAPWSGQNMSNTFYLLPDTRKNDMSTNVCHAALYFVVISKWSHTKKQTKDGEHNNLTDTGFLRPILINLEVSKSDNNLIFF